MNSAVVPQSAETPKLPLWNTIGLAYSTYLHYFADVLRISWLWLVLCAPLIGITNIVQWYIMAGVLAEMRKGVSPQMPAHWSMPAEMAVLGSISGLFLVLASVGIAVAWHRRIILGEYPRFSGSNIATKSFWRYVGVGIAISLTILPAPVFQFLFSRLAGGLVPGRTNSGYAVLILGILVLFFTSLVVILRLSLLLPARAIGDVELTFKQAWTNTRRNTWRLFWGIAASMLLPMLLVELALISFHAFPAPGEFQTEAFGRRMAIIGTILSLSYLVLLPIGIGFLSLAYRHFFRRS